MRPPVLGRFHWVLVVSRELPHKILVTEFSEEAVDEGLMVLEWFFGGGGVKCRVNIETSPTKLILSSTETSQSRSQKHKHH